MSHEEKDVVKAVMLAASESIGAVLAEAEKEGIVDEDGKEIPLRVAAIVATTTLASMYAAASGLSKERFLQGMEMTFDHAVETYEQAEAIIKQMEMLEQTQGENKWVQ